MTCIFCTDQVFTRDSVQTSCGHVFHYNCLQTWFEKDFKTRTRPVFKCAICTKEQNLHPKELRRIIPYYDERQSKLKEIRDRYRLPRKGRENFDAEEGLEITTTEELCERYFEILADADTLKKRDDFIRNELKLEDVQKFLKEERLRSDAVRDMRLENAKLTEQLCSQELCRKDLEGELECARENLDLGRNQLAEAEKEKRRREIHLEDMGKQIEVDEIRLESLKKESAERRLQQYVSEFVHRISSNSEEARKDIAKRFALLDVKLKNRLLSYIILLKHEKNEEFRKQEIILKQIHSKREKEVQHLRSTRCKIRYNKSRAEHEAIRKRYPKRI